MKLDIFCDSNVQLFLPSYDCMIMPFFVDHSCHIIYPGKYEETITDYDALVPYLHEKSSVSVLISIKNYLLVLRDTSRKYYNISITLIVSLLVLLTCKYVLLNNLLVYT